MPYLFIIPSSRFRYRRTLMGHCSTSDAYTKCFDDSIQDIQRKYKCVNDSLPYDTCDVETFWHTYEFLDTCTRAGITFEPEKFRYCPKEVEFMGFHLVWEHYQTISERLAAIREFAMPHQPTISNIRSWHGMTNQLVPFLATDMDPFRELLKRPAGKRVYWDDHQTEATLFQLANDTFVYYNESRPTAVVMDWSKEGLEFVALHQYCSCTSPDVPFSCRRVMAPGPLWQPSLKFSRSRVFSRRGRNWWWRGVCAKPGCFS